MVGFSELLANELLSLCRAVLNVVVELFLFCVFVLSTHVGAVNTCADDPPPTSRGTIGCTPFSNPSGASTISPSPPPDNLVALTASLFVSGESGDPALGARPLSSIGSERAKKRKEQQARACAAETKCMQTLVPADKPFLPYCRPNAFNDARFCSGHDDV